MDIAVHTGSISVWTVFFMRKMMRRTLFCLTLAGIIWCGGMLRDYETVHNELIRLHVVANSDSPEDQAVKLKVRDAVIESLEEDLQKIGDVEAAKTYLREKLPYIQQVANDALESAGFSPDAAVSLCREAFDTRYYDTFTLPAGVYEALRITIGEGNGRNWWCVTFPGLCLPATTEGFESEAVGAGFSDTLTDTLTGQPTEIRFFLLDAFCRLENMFFAG